ncbi:MAG: UDP-N-acetylglucosamine 4,6-dehydratase/5-epimerase [Candidatus Woesearchaeota archaeon]|nr:UDP-N-acetylglucosamine 4,6-dehydratase/5-epimerase [Candidatus Woesearchaeota archaeon]MDI3543792.1 UDP-N-acetylglucosamine 4,6-dehydratase/5-epimerase [Candidatus Woesearchaeota archaeon]
MANNFLNGKRILITGGTGSWGNVLVERILKDFSPKKIIIYSRGELRQVSMKRRLNNPKLEFVIGDVRNKERLNLLCKESDIIFHLAALKHVTVCEENPTEAIDINIKGTENVVNCAIENNIEKVVYVSTDKAVAPINLYGVTKAASERLIVNANLRNGKTIFSCIRAGNVMGSSGSVIPLFRKQIALNNMITVTDEGMTRFIMSLEEAIGLLLKAAELSIGGEIFVMQMPGIKVMDLAKVMAKELGDKNTKIKITGIRPGEKIDEVLVSQDEIHRTVEFGKYFVIMPYVPIKKAIEKYKNMKKPEFEYYSSNNTKMLSLEEIKEVLKRNHFLGKDYEYDELIGGLNREEMNRIEKKEKWLI